MKKLFALLISAFTLTSVFAQDHSKDGRDMDRGYSNSNVYNGSKSNYAREKDAAVERINREFNRQIDFVRNDRRLSRREKNRQISQLERQRDQQIREAIARFDNRNGRYDDGRFAQSNKRF